MKKALLFALSLALISNLFGCSAAVGRETYSKTTADLFDTVTTISATDSSQKSFDTHYDEVYKQLKMYSDLFDIYKPYDSVVNLEEVNENASSQGIEVSDSIIELFEFGKEAYEKTNGKVNIAMGSVLSLWHAERENALKDSSKARLPDMKMLREASRHADINSIVTDKKSNTVLFKDDKLSVDVGAIAKGFVCEKISEYINRNNIWSSAVISIGGNVKVIGFKNDRQGSNFNIALENPNGSDYLCTVGVSDGLSVVTSGNYQRYYEVNSKRYCHIIDPDTLMPPEYATAVTVICKDSAVADMLSTELFCMSVDEGRKIISTLENTEALWVDNNQKVIYSEGFEEYIN